MTGTYVKGYKVYFDATLSKLSYEGSASDDSIPRKNERIYYHAWNNETDTEEDTEDGEMTLVSEHSKNGHVWKDVYVASLEKKYKNILFYNGKNLNDYLASSNKAAQTINLQIPWETEKSPCFYADTSDSVIYDNKNREGYWDEVYTIRSPEKEGGNAKSVVDISSAQFTRENDTLYVNSTFYDYYTDFELNGKNRDNYGGANGASHRNWVNFRQFDQALSDYYESCNAEIPLYTGHFQPSEYNYLSFTEIAGTLGLWKSDQYKNFISSNLSLIHISEPTRH